MRKYCSMLLLIAADHYQAKVKEHNFSGGLRGCCCCCQTTRHMPPCGFLYLSGSGSSIVRSLYLFRQSELFLGEPYLSSSQAQSLEHESPTTTNEERMQRFDSRFSIVIRLAILKLVMYVTRIMQIQMGECEAYSLPHCSFCALSRLFRVYHKKTYFLLSNGTGMRKGQGIDFCHTTVCQMYINI